MIDSVSKYMRIVEEASVIDDNWFKDNSFEVAKKTDQREPFEIADHDGTIQTLEGPVTYREGDYIITGPKKEQYPISPETFRELKIDNGDGTASPKKIVKLAKMADHDGYVVLKYNGSKLHYNKGEDIIVRHGPGDYGAVKKDIFAQTYEKQ